MRSILIKPFSRKGLSQKEVVLKTRTTFPKHSIPLRHFQRRGNWMNRVKLLRIVYKNLDSQMEREILGSLAEEERGKEE